MKADPKASRVEALRRAMLAYKNDASSFSVIGERAQ
jgi:hypothetical protein